MAVNITIVAKYRDFEFHFESIFSFRMIAENRFCQLKQKTTTEWVSLSYLFWDIFVVR